MIPDRVNVCLVSKLFSPAYSGAAERFERYAPGLRQRGIHMNVLTTTLHTNIGKTAQPGEVFPVDYINDLPVQRIHITRENEYGLALLRYFRDLTDRPDVIQFLTLPSLPLLFAIRRLKIPLVFTRTMMAEFSANPVKRVLQRIHRRAPYQLVDQVVVSTRLMQDSLHEMGVTVPIKIILNGLDLKRFCPVTSPEARYSIRQQLGLDPTGEIILFVGPLMHRKGVDTLAEIWDELARKRPNAYLVLVGPGSKEVQGENPEFETHIRNIFAQSGAANRVIFTGSVSNVENYFQAADLFVFPSRREGFGNVIVEAFGCGLATILTPFIGLAEECGRPGKEYLLVERSPEALLQAILNLLDNSDRRQELGLIALQWAKKHLDVEVSLDQYAALYKSLVDRSSAEKPESTFEV